MLRTPLKIMALMFSVSALPAVAAEWTLDGDRSNLAFGSIKSEFIGEVHRFPGLSGSVSSDGAVEITIDLASVDTDIDIRNERMVEFVFEKAPDATLSATVDMSELEALAPGESVTLEADTVVSFLGREADYLSELFVLRVSDDLVMVSTDSMIMMDLDDLELNPAIDTLQEIAGLESITRAAPIVARLMFERSE